MKVIECNKKLAIIVKVIPHEEQRYNTVGDWFVDYESAILEIRVSATGCWKMDMLIAYHELTEALLCLHHGVREEQVTAFDIEYEKKRKPGDNSEPGNSIKAPYYNEHQFATSMESFLATQLEVNWDKYEERINMLSGSYVEKPKAPLTDKQV